MNREEKIEYIAKQLFEQGSVERIAEDWLVSDLAFQLMIKQTKQK